MNGIGLAGDIRWSAAALYRPLRATRNHHPSLPLALCAPRGGGVACPTWGVLTTPHCCRDYSPGSRISRRQLTCAVSGYGTHGPHEAAVGFQIRAAYGVR